MKISMTYFSWSSDFALYLACSVKPGSVEIAIDQTICKYSQRNRRTALLIAVFLSLIATLHR